MRPSLVLGLIALLVADVLLWARVPAVIAVELTGVLALQAVLVVVTAIKRRRRI